MTSAYDIVIIGGGPAGLAAAIAASRQNLTYRVFEKGALVNSLLHYPTDMVFFTTPELLEIGGFPFVSPHEKPSRKEALKYYRRVTDAVGLQVAIREEVTALVRRTDGTFEVTSRPARGAQNVCHARVVMLATGAYDVPNRLDVPGEDRPHVSHYFHEPHEYYRQRLLIVGGKNSAAEAALESYRAGAEVLLVHRGSELGASIKYWVKPDIENRIAEGSIRARFGTRVVEIGPDVVTLAGPDGEVREPVDAVLLLTGYRADTTLLTMVGADVEPATGAPVHDPETFESSVPNLFVIGACVAGKQSGQIFIENGRFHGEVAVRTAAARLAETNTSSQPA